MKPTVFIGSSSENLDFARAVQSELRHDAFTNVWNQGNFKTNQLRLEALLSTLGSSDFGVFICCPDDSTKSRGKKLRKVRDNVIFEAGLFIGKLGKERAFLLVPEEERPDFPSDLLGIDPLCFEANSPNTLQSALGACCTEIRDAIKKFGIKRAFDEEIRRQSLEQMAVCMGNLTNFVRDQTFLNSESADRFWKAYAVAHNHAQTIADHVWPGAGVVVSLKLPANENRRPTELRCYYLIERLPARRVQVSGGEPFPETIPIKGSVAGLAFSTGRLQVIEDASVAIQGVNAKFKETHLKNIGSIVANPICLDGKIIGVVKMDAETRGFFRKEDRRVEAVVRAISSCFESAFRVAILPASKTLVRKRQAIRGTPH